MKTEKKLPESVHKLYMRYQAIPVPYYQEKQRRKLKSSLYKGKADINAIEAFIRTQHKTSVSKKELLEKAGIGIDCSGFIARLYDLYTVEKYGKHVWEYFTRKTKNPVSALLYRFFPIVSMLNAATLTSDINCEKIMDLKEILPLDLIKMSGGKHVVMVHSVEYTDAIPTKIRYIHATEKAGVCMGEIIVTDAEKSIATQKWVPVTSPEPKHQPFSLIRYKVNTNGIRRPKFLLL